ncbi:hypothetical protein ACSBR2_003808 [Camellia fascicularis]
MFKADLPGLKKEEVKVEIEEDDRVLQISSERNFEKEEKNDTWHRVQRSSGRFTRRFRLPENTKMYEVKASMENRVLTVTVPKVEVRNPDLNPLKSLVKIKIKSNGRDLNNLLNRIRHVINVRD